jgi:hypothetical protein
MIAPYVERAWHELPEAVRTGQPVFPGVHGLGFWDYLAAHPAEGARFDAAMSGGAERAQTLMAVRDLSGLVALVDVGGGQGHLLAAALAAVPGLRGVLLTARRSSPERNPSWLTPGCGTAATLSAVTS